MDRMWYDVKGDPLAVLKESGLDWRATGDFALDTILERRPTQYSVYVRTGDEAKWKNYLKSKDAVPKEIFPQLVLFPTTNFDLLSNGAYSGVPVVKLDQILKDADPRYVENIQPIISKIELKYLGKSA